jgi:hypothetical protein
MKWQISGYLDQRLKNWQGEIAKRQGGDEGSMECFGIDYRALEFWQISDRLIRLWKSVRERRSLGGIGS